MSYNNILYDVQENIATITVNRPDKLNALNTETFKELFDAFKKANGDNTISGVILTGSGEKAFVAGADISELAVQLQRILSDVGSWKTGDVAVERQEERVQEPVEPRARIQLESPAIQALGFRPVQVAIDGDGGEQLVPRPRSRVDGQRAVGQLLDPGPRGTWLDVVEHRAE